MSPRAGQGPDQAILLEQVSWIRRLARELVADRELAEDLVQETCRVALEHAPREPGKLRQWLGKVLRNALRQHARSQGRRLAREATVARAEALEPTDRLVERVLLQRELVNAVLELDEPYRATVLLRFFEDLPPREIARRTGTPIATVHSRLQRALAKLRERLDGQCGTWAMLLLPWARGLESFGPPTLFTVIMKTKLLVALGAAVLAAGAFVLLQSSPASERLAGIEPAAEREERNPTPAAGGFGGGDHAPVGEREVRVPAPQDARPATGTTPTAVPVEWTVRLRVLGAEGLPMPGIAVRALTSEGVLGTSGAGGWCVFPTRSEQLELVAADPRWVTVHGGSPARGSSVAPVLVLAPAMTVAGVVLDESGRRLPGASVRFELPRGFTTRFSEVLEASRPNGWRTAGDAQGGFVFERVPAVPGSTLTGVLAGYEHGRIDAPEGDAHGLELVLVRPRLPLAGVLRGSVLDWYGAPVAEARVGLGLTSVVSDEQGRFEVSLARAVTADALVAVKVGYLPARQERPGEPGPGRSGWPEHVTLVLSGPALGIAGRVLDHEGEAVGGARVWLHDPTPGAPIGQMPSFLEGLMAGAPLPPSALESEARLPSEDGDQFMDWQTNARAPSVLWNWVVTDATGHFELGGLDQRRYRLDVLRPGTLEVGTSESIAAGERSVIVRLDPPDVFEQVEGHVLSGAGTALEGVRVDLYRPVIDARARIFGGNSQVVLIEHAGFSITDGDGRFVFENVPRRGAELSVRADGIVPAKAEIRSDRMEVRVEVRCHLEVVLREPVERFDGIAVVDAEGQGLDLLVLTEGSVNAWTDAPLVQGRSGVVSVSERARVLQLLRDGAVVETRALALLPGDVNRIEL